MLAHCALTLTPLARKRLREQLIRLKAGDRSAFTPIYDALLPLTVGFARRLVGPNEAEDAAQQALIKLFAQANAYDESKDVATWALSLTAWECRTLNTRARRRREVPIEGALEHAQYDPTLAMLERKVLEEARAILLTLSPMDQDTLRRAFADEGRGPTFRKRKQRALARLLAAWRTSHG